MNTIETLRNAFKNKEAKVAIVGLGYVGLPLAVEVAKSGLKTIGFDIDPEKIRRINAGESYIPDVPPAALQQVVRSGMLSATTDKAKLGEAHAVIICVPTPLRKTRDPDVSFVVHAGEAIAGAQKGPQLVVLESTTYPGFTREVLIPLFAAAGRKLDHDIFLAFSPERVDPGNAKFHTRNTPKIIGGCTDLSRELTTALYKNFIDNIVPVGTADAAEMVKLLENTFRAVNIGLVNETAIMCNKLGLNVWEVIEAAATKPFGFMPFWPGPGLGGHCIPVDPHYLSWKLRTLHYDARFIELAGEVNRSMPNHVVNLVQQALNKEKKAVNGAKVLLMGVAYKPNVGDVRESPALDVIRLMLELGADLRYHDPYVPSLHEEGFKLDSTSIGDPGQYDCIVVITNHAAFDMAEICKHNVLLVDTRGSTRKLTEKPRARIVLL